MMGMNGASGAGFLRDSTRSKAALLVGSLLSSTEIFVCYGKIPTVSDVSSARLLVMYTV